MRISQYPINMRYLVHGKNYLYEISNILVRCRSENNFVRLNQNNYVGLSLLLKLFAALIIVF